MFVTFAAHAPVNATTTMAMSVAIVDVVAVTIPTRPFRRRRMFRRSIRMNFDATSQRRVVKRSLVDTD